MLHRTYDDPDCSIARALEIVGERWTLMILRDAYLGIRRFDELQRDLGISRGILAQRLQHLVDEEILELCSYQERPPRHEYRLTEKGRDLWPVIMALVHWGDRYEAENGPPRLFWHTGCGGELTEHLMCAKCGAELGVRDVETRLAREKPAAA